MAYTTIDKPSATAFNTKLYTGNSTDNHAQTGIGFQPDFVWIKGRVAGGYNHNAFDAVRGVTKYIRPNGTGAEVTDALTLKSFDSDGFTLGTDTTNSEVNHNTKDYVAWNWKANGAGSANTDGSINTTATSVNTTSGFSISKYTGTGSNASIGHGLGAIPHMAIFKRIDAAGYSWFVYHRSLGAGKFSVLDATNAEQSSTSIWQNTTPTSSLITLGSDGGVNASGGTYICYAFSEKTGYSKFGSYVGDGNADGTFVYTGFKPSFVMIKYVAPNGGVGSWHMYDNKRIGYNTENDYVQANTSSSENSDTDQIDLLSNGFKCRATGSDSNESGSTYIFMAFAEAPLVGSNNIPATAR